MFFCFQNSKLNFFVSFSDANTNGHCEETLSKQTNGKNHVESDKTPIDRNNNISGSGSNNNQNQDISSTTVTRSLTPTPTISVTPTNNKNIVEDKQTQNKYLNGSHLSPAVGSPQPPAVSTPDSILKQNKRNKKDKKKQKKRNKQKRCSISDSSDYERQELDENIELKLCRAKRLKLKFGNDSISIDIEQKFNL